LELETWHLALRANGALDRLIDEANQLTRIFASIAKKQDDSES
tara:strand:- start:362 stop:490 length:129 start_codon:yes stop_codon:yes gene_type:complete